MRRARLVVTLTLDEAAALLTRFALDPQTASLSGLHKIQTALEQAIDPPTRPTRQSISIDTPPADDYVPWRDEANGIWE